MSKQETVVVPEANDAKFGSHSPLTDELIEEVFGSEARQGSFVTRSAQGKYIVGRRHQRRSLQAALSSGDVSDLKTVNVLQEVFGLERMTPGLDVICRPRPMPKLVMRYFISSQSTAHRKVAKGEEPSLNLHAYLKVDMELWLNASHIAEFYEDTLESDIPIMSIDEQDAAGALRAARDLDVADALAGATEISTGHDWGEKTSNVSDHDPMDDIAPAMAILTGGGSDNGYVAANPRYCIMHPDAWADLAQNTFVQKFFIPSLTNTVGIPGPSQLRFTAYPNVIFMTHASVTPSTSAFLVDPYYFILGQGPTQAVGYQNDIKRCEGHVLFEYLQPKLVVDQSNTYTVGARELTGIHA